MRSSSGPEMCFCSRATTESGQIQVFSGSCQWPQGQGFLQYVHFTLSCEGYFCWSGRAKRDFPILSNFATWSGLRAPGFVHSFLVGGSASGRASAAAEGALQKMTSKSHDLALRRRSGFMRGLGHLRHRMRSFFSLEAHGCLRSGSRNFSTWDYSISVACDQTTCQRPSCFS
jgi:hypothetical protein